MIKKIALVVVAIFALIQFIRPERNLSDDRTYDVAKSYLVPQAVNTILQSACLDCHSNKTNYPGYANIQPVGWWLASHVNDGKRHLNFSTFTRLPIAVQNHKFEEVVEMVKEMEMPLPSYTWMGLHQQANLSDDERRLIVDWAQAQMDSLKATHPPDSLVMKRRSPPPAQ
jgi:Haem-binding domain